MIIYTPFYSPEPPLAFPRHFSHNHFVEEGPLSEGKSEEKFVRKKSKWDKKPPQVRSGPDMHWHLCDKENRDALIYNVWPELAAKIMDLNRRNPDAITMSLRKLEMWVKPTRLLTQLRCIFWARVYEARELQIRVKKIEVLVGFMNESTWVEIIKSDANLAYFIRPIPRIESAYEMLLFRAIKNLSLMCEMPEGYLLKENAVRLNYLSTLFSVIRRCEARLGRRGAGAHRESERERIVQEIEGEGKRLNISKPPDDPSYLDGFDLEDLPEDDFEGEEKDGSNSRHGDDEVSEEGS